MREMVQLIDDLGNHIGVVQWVKDNGGEAWVSPLGSHITVVTPNGNRAADIGDYVVHEGHGVFSVRRSS